MTPRKPCDDMGRRRRRQLRQLDQRHARPGGRPRIDNSAEGIAAARARVATPAPALSRDELHARGLDEQTLAELRARRKGEWIDHHLELLQLSGLIALRWAHERADDRVELLAEIEEGRRVLASVFTPALRAQLDFIWDALNQYGGPRGRFWCGRFLAAYLTPSS